MLERFDEEMSILVNKVNNSIIGVVVSFLLIFVFSTISLITSFVFLLFLSPVAVIVISYNIYSVFINSEKISILVKERNQKLANQLEYYRDSVLHYGIFNVVAMLDELSMKQDERSVLAGIMLYFTHKGILEETVDGYKIVKESSNSAESRFLNFLLPNGFDTKEKIKKRMSESAVDVFTRIEPTLVKEGYLKPYNPYKDHTYDHVKPGGLKYNFYKFNEELKESYKVNYGANRESPLFYLLTESGEKMANEIMGSYRFLKDFTIINERNKIDLALWDDYLVMATLYNMAEKVEIDLEDIMPEWRRLSYE